MNNNNRVLYSIIVAVLILALVALGVYAYQQRDTDKVDDTDTSNIDTDKKDDAADDELTNTSFKSEKGVIISLSSPTRGAMVASPLKVAGTVPGNWSHEGQFSVRLLDDQSKTLADGVAKLDGDWMTENPVDFSTELTFEAPESGKMGILVLEKANPSGLQENADSLTVPIKF